MRSRPIYCVFFNKRETDCIDCERMVFDGEIFPTNKKKNSLLPLLGNRILSVIDLEFGPVIPLRQAQTCLFSHRISP